MTILRAGGATVDFDEERLQDPAISGKLAHAGSEALEAIVRLFRVFEATPTRYVKLTTLSKVFHRKRPGLLPLFDDITIAIANARLPPCHTKKAEAGTTTDEVGLVRFRTIWRRSFRTGRKSRRWLRDQRSLRSGRWTLLVGS